MLNNIIIAGRFVRDPELRRTNTGKAVTSFTLAVDRDGEGCDFIPCVAWEATAERIANYFYKGKMALVSGRLQQRDYSDKEGRKRTAYEVVVGRIYFTDKKEETKPTASDFMLMEDDDDALPFA